MTDSFTMEERAAAPVFMGEEINSAQLSPLWTKL
jgi:hypothetical protein